MRGRSVFRLAVVGALTAGLVAGGTVTAQADGLPLPYTCKKENAVEAHGSGVYFYDFFRSYVRRVGNYNNTYNEYGVGFYTIYGPVAVGVVTKLCGRVPVGVQSVPVN